MNADGQVLRMLGALLDYPDQRLVDGLDEIRACLLHHPALPPPARAALRELLDKLSKRTLLELQEDYVDIFDRGRATSLYLFEHVHGESRERGQAMVDLLAMYEARGLFLEHGELPDFLPVFLEFAAQETPRQARVLLGEIEPICRSIATGLAARDQPYYAAVAALLPLAGAAPLAHPGVTADDGALARSDTAALDEEWESEPVTFVGAPAPEAASARAHAGEQRVEFYRKRPSP